MLRDDQLGQANGSLGSVREALRLVAPLAGAALYAAFGGPAVAVLDAATFLVSAAALLAPAGRRAGAGTHRAAVPRRGERRQPAPARQPGAARHGGRYVICMLAIGIAESVFFAVVDEGLGKPVEFIGVLGAVQGVGAIMRRASPSPILIRRTGELRPVPWAFALMAVGVAARDVVLAARWSPPARCWSAPASRC